MYVGQTLTLLIRGRSHPVWRQTVQNFEKPYAAYKIVDYEDLTITKCELVYEESLLIELLRPK